MRPIYKGSHPRTPEKNLVQVFTDWTKAIPILKARTGDYCHLCEMRITSAIEIEHILPKKHFTSEKSNWDNFILACTHCNSSKSDNIPIGSTNYADHYYYPHLHNTFLAFEYNPLNRCLPCPNNSHLTTATQRNKAQNLIDLYKLDKTSINSGEIDNRYKHRLEALQKACARRVEFAGGLCTIRNIIDMATSTGFLSVWLAIFDAVPSVKEALLNAPQFHLQGQTPMSFDSSLNWLPRNPTNTTNPI